MVAVYTRGKTRSEKTGDAEEMRMAQMFTDLGFVESQKNTVPSRDIVVGASLFREGCIGNE